MLQGKGATLPSVLLVLTLLSPAVMAQTSSEKQQQTSKAKKKLKLNFRYDHDPRELQDDSQRYKRWLKIKGVVGIGTYHIPVGYEKRPYNAPALSIWGQGFGTSLWRDPVTGRPIL